MNLSVIVLIIFNSWSAPSHYLNGCWNIVNWNLRYKLQWNLIRYSSSKGHLRNGGHFCPGRDELTFPIPCYSLLQSVFIIGEVIDRLLLCGRYYINVDITVISREPHGVSNHLQLLCVFNCFFRRQPWTLKFRVIIQGNPRVIKIKFRNRKPFFKKGNIQFNALVTLKYQSNTCLVPPNRAEFETLRDLARTRLSGYWNAPNWFV